MRPLSLLVALWFLTGWATAAPVINEVQATNPSFPDPSGQRLADDPSLYPDWVEIHNPTAAPLNMAGYYLSDSASNPLKYQFPEVTIEAGGFLIIWAASTGDFPNSRTEFHANFGISSGGEPVVLTAPDGTTMVDSFPALIIGTGRSLGRGIGADLNTLYFYAAPTFSAANTTSGTEALPLEAPVFSLPGGIYDSDQSLTLSSPVEGAVIRYTTDGAEPTESSPAYAGPIALTEAGNSSTGYSWIPTNQGEIGDGPFYDAWRQPDGVVARMNVVRARVFQNGRAGRVATRSYLIHPDGTNRHDFPVVSIVTDPANLFSNEKGIYVPGGKSGFDQNFFQSGSGWERASSLEVYENDGRLVLKGEIGLRINGNTTRSRPRKALRIYNRNPDGATTWQNTQLFPGKDMASWDTFLLRAGGNDWNQAGFRDALVSEISAPTGLDRQHARPAVLYLDGEYWGIHNLRERLDEGWFFHNYGLQESEFTLLEVTSGGPNPLNPASDNSWPIYDKGNPALLDDYKDILVRAGNNEYADEAGYAALAARIDLDSYIDYQAVTIWSGNTDWPGNNTLMWRAVNPNTAPGANPRLDGRWRYVIKDNDFALGLNLPYVPGHDYNVTVMAQHNTLAYASSPTETTFANNEIGTRLLRKTLENPLFRTKFINRFADLLNTALSREQTQSELDAFESAYAPGMDEHQRRWPTGLTWSNEVSRIRGYLQARTEAVRGHIVQKFGLPGTAALTVDVADTSQGSVTVNTLPIDPATAGIATNPYPWTGTYFQGVPVTITAVPKPGYRFVSWSSSMEDGGADAILATDAASNYSSWSNGANGGTGFGPWALNASTGDTRRAGTFLDNGRGGWGLYANDRETAVIYRSLSNAMQVGETFTMRVRHGSVDDPGDVGFELANSNGGSLFKLATFWSSSTYVINGSTTEIPVTTNPLDIEITLASSNSYTARITPVGGSTYTNTGTLSALSDQTVRRFIAYNYSAGSGSGADVFVTSLQVAGAATPGGGTSTSYSTNATITPTLAGAAEFRAAFEVEPAAALAITPPVWTTGFSNAPVTVRAVNSLGDTDATFTGRITLTLTGPEGVIGTLTADAVDGVATFEAFELGAGGYTLSAAAGELATAAPVELAVRALATFLPAGDGLWHVATNWDAGAVPNGPAVSVVIPPNTAANRSVTNNAPTTVAAITFELGTSAFRNRITGTAGQPLTLQSTNGTSTITVIGTGAGHANIEVPGGLILSNETVLDVQNTGSTNPEYGSLRLQGAVSGPGAIIKRGPGLAGITGSGKIFSGDIVIEQGVLTFSEPAISANGVTNYTVQPGGQLRLSSAGNPRNYLFKGPLQLAGSGRTGVPESENLGVLGALRLETGGTGTLAVLTNNIHLTDSADVHVPAGNALRFNGPLTSAANSNVLTKSGGGTLVLSSNASAFTGGLAVNRGTLQLDEAALTNTSRPLILTNETVLTGTGQWGGSLEALSGSTLAFTTPAAPDVVAPLRAGSFSASGTVTIAVAPGEGAVEGAYPLLTIDGTASGAGNLALALASTNFTASSLSLTNGTLYAVLKSSASAREAWLAQYGLPVDGSGEGADTADPDGDGIANLIERALFLDPTMAESGLPVTLGEPGVDSISFTYRVAKGQSDLTVEVVTSSSLTSDEPWLPLEPVAVDDTPPDYTVYRVELPTAEGAGFLRLEVPINPAKSLATPSLRANFSHYASLPRSCGPHPWRGGFPRPRGDHRAGRAVRLRENEYYGGHRHCEEDDLALCSTARRSIDHGQRDRSHYRPHGHHHHGSGSRSGARATLGPGYALPSRDHQRCGQRSHAADLHDGGQHDEYRDARHR